MQNILVCFFYCAALSVVEDAAADEKKGKLYKPKSRVLETKSFLPLDTPPQFLAVDKRNVSVFIFKPKNFLSLHFLQPIIHCLGIKEGRKGKEKEQPWTLQRRTKTVGVSYLFLTDSSTFNTSKNVI